MSRLIGYALLATALVVAVVVGFQIELLIGLSEDGLELLGPRIRSRIFWLAFCGVIVPLGFAGLILRKN